MIHMLKNKFGRWGYLFIHLYCDVQQNTEMLKKYIYLILYMTDKLAYHRLDSEIKSSVVRPGSSHVLALYYITEASVVVKYLTHTPYFMVRG